jgi:hypothetical protein
VQPGRARVGDELTNAFAEPLARLGDGEEERSVDACQYGCPTLRDRPVELRRAGRIVCRDLLCLFDANPADRRDPGSCGEILLFGAPNP